MGMKELRVKHRRGGGGELMSGRRNAPFSV